MNEYVLAATKSAALARLWACLTISKRSALRSSRRCRMAAPRSSSAPPYRGIGSVVHCVLRPTALQAKSRIYWTRRPDDFHTAHHLRPCLAVLSDRKQSRCRRAGSRRKEEGTAPQKSRGRSLGKAMREAEQDGDHAIALAVVRLLLLSGYRISEA